MSYKMAERELQEWANGQYRVLPEVARKDIRRANWDLFNGPGYDEGATRFNFTAACARISAALADISDVWVDIQSGEVIAQEPDWEATYEHEFMEEEAGSCNWPAYHPEDYVHFERSQVIAAIVGKELAKYIS